jgi:hypothetical protein
VASKSLVGFVWLYSATKQKEATATMPSNNKNAKGVKMSLGDFMGGPPAAGVNALPTAPKERG